MTNRAAQDHSALKASFCSRFVDKLNEPIGRTFCFVAFILATLLFCFFSGHIDFHPDETIYFDGIPFSLRNDTGLFYSLIYQIAMMGKATPEKARMVSAALGGGSLFFVLMMLREKRETLALGLLAFVGFVVSYQSVFLFDRVRPEAAWWFCLCGCVWAMHRYEQKLTRSAYAWVLLFAALLPMNHRLAWFACAFVSGFALLFWTRREGWKKSFGVPLAMAAGVLMNMFGRAALVGVSMMGAVQSSLGSPPAQRSGVIAFLKNAFIDAPHFLNDRAANANFYEVFVDQDVWFAPYLNHVFVQHALWFLLLFLPLAGRTMRERFMIAFPLFALCAFYASGYFNPTYVAGFVLCGVMSLLFIIRHPSLAVRYGVMIVMGLSIVNGASFLATRVVNHNEATYFAEESSLHAMLSRFEGKKVAVPERFQSVYRGLKIEPLITYKQPLPADLSLLVVDAYDAEMYRFVPDYDVRRAEILDRAKKMCLVDERRIPVYVGDSLDSQARSYLDKKSDMIYLGSWFFRNSATYGLLFYQPCP